MDRKLGQLTDQQRTSLREKMLDDPKFITGSKQGLQHIDGNIVQMDDVIAAITPQNPHDKFAFLSQWFREGTWMLSSSTQIDRHPAARMILDMKTKAIPMVLDELNNHPHHWYGILRHLTGAQPVPPEHAGYMKEIRQDWLDWGRQNGHIQTESQHPTNPSTSQHHPSDGENH